jgi:hypothetical protein
MKTSTLLWVGVIGVGAYFLLFKGSGSGSAAGMSGGSTSGTQTAKPQYTNTPAQILDAIGGLLTGAGNLANGIRGVSYEGDKTLSTSESRTLKDIFFG